MASASLPRIFAALIAGLACAGRHDDDESAILQVRRERSRSARVGIVTMTREPADFEDWARYHLDYVGVEHIFLRVENTPGWNGTWDSMSPGARSRITVWHDFVEAQPANNYMKQMDRQGKAMDRAMALATKMGLDWLFHIDDDELIYIPSKLKAGEVLAKVPSDVEEVHVQNLEAVYDSVNDERCFRHVHNVNAKLSTFSAYVNGKSGARVTANMSSWGVHFWKHRNGSVNVSTLNYKISYESARPVMPPLALLHYESCLVSRWMDKFWALARITDKSAEPPFPFYKESIARMQECQGKMASLASLLDMQHVSLSDTWQALPNDPHCTKSALQRLWAKFKTLQNPRISADALLPITIPWHKIVQ